ncbi:MAG: hypothetical protein KCHDKBKB_01496 [Elusimicrobia bacterium]|nr:hypothetical protein [Elusimicrobiota bacterium]
MKRGANHFAVLCLILSLISVAHSKGPGTTGALLLLEPTGARSAALAQAYTAGSNDISILGYNPGALPTLKTGYMSFSYQRGLEDDRLGQFLIGGPTRNGHVGLTFQALDEGTLTVVENGQSRDVNVQRDMMLGLSYGRQFRGLSVGFSGKYFQSELIESESARALAADVGILWSSKQRWRFGAAMQNIGTKLQFREIGDPLPRLIRTGLSVNLGNVNKGIILLADALYHMNEEEWRPGMGLEWPVGPLAFRGGIRHSSQQDELTFGTGFLFGSSQIDYALGLFGSRDSIHRLAWSMKFGRLSSSSEFVKESKNKTSQTARVGTSSSQRRHNLNGSKQESKPTRRVREIYIVQRGDSLAKISKKVYGRADLWTQLYAANRHLISDTRQLEVGQKIIIP